VTNGYALGPFRLDTQGDLLFHESEPVTLGRRAVALLQALVERPGAVVSKDALIEAAWPNQAVEESNLTVQIAALRRILGEAPGGDRWIETMPRRGYRFVGPVVIEAEIDVTTASSWADAAADLTPAPHADAERRQITAMSCELVGSQGQADGIDLEDWREVVGAFRHCVSETAERHDGFIHWHLGNDVLVLFGYPAAHEQDAEQAVRAGLQLCAAVKALRPDADILMWGRVGIATGMVIVGDGFGGSEGGRHEIIGDLPDLAARLRISAPPGTVAIEPVTRRLISDLFDCRDLSALEIGSNAEPIRCWQVTGERVIESRFEALRGPTLSPLIGRDEEVDLLLRRWADAKTGNGQAVLVSGEPGIGKSRLVAALAVRQHAEPHFLLRYFCSPNHQNSALHPFIAQLERAARFAPDNTPEEKVDKLTTLIAPCARDRDEVTLIADLLSLPSGAAELGLTSQRKREKLLAALLHQLKALARQQPVLMVVEDLHWIDPSSRELLDLIIERAANLPVLLILTFRPEFQAPWNGLPQVTALILSRLDRRSGAEMVERIAGNDKLSDALAAEIVAKTDGVPLFVEELTKAVLESGLLVAAPQGWRLDGLSPSFTIPVTLQGSLAARLDRLASVKEIAQIAAAIGREFSYELLAPVAGRGDTELQDALGRLADAGLVFSRGTPPAATYLFKHALVRDAAYGSLLRRRREELHARIAAVLETDFREAVAAEPELLARHLTQAELLEQAARWWLHAGERATERSANMEAVAHLERGIEVLMRLPESRGRDEQELLFQAALIVPLSATEGYGSAMRMRAASRAVELGGRVGADSPTQFRAAWARRALAVDHMHRGSLRVALPFAAETLSLAKQFGDPHFLIQSNFVMGQLQLYLGNSAASRRHLEKGFALYRAERDRAAAAHVGYDVCMGHHTWLASVLWYQGFPDQALWHAEEASTVARAAAHPFSEAWATSYVASLHQSRGEVAPCRERAEATLALATEQGLPYWGAVATALAGWALVKQGQSEEGLARLRAGTDAYRAIGAKVTEPVWLALLAEACLEAGRVEEGLTATREALVEVEETAARYYEAELNRLDGELRLAAEEPDESRAEASFVKAIEIAGDQGAKSFELRAAASLAGLWRDQGRRVEARDLLAPVYSWFTEGFDTLDLKEAKLLLDELR
jgi:DNA-binding winged helix-turn-helix (wHTH) protein